MKTHTLPRWGTVPLRQLQIPIGHDDQVSGEMEEKEKKDMCIVERGGTGDWRIVETD